MSRDLLGFPAGRAVAAVLFALVVAAIVGMATLWPRAGGDGLEGPAVAATERADVERVERRACRQSVRSPCQVIAARLESGRETTITLPGTDVAPEVAPGDAIRLVANDFGGVPPPPGTEAYAFADFERRGSLYLLAAVFALLVIAMARWKGVRSLLGLALSLVVVTQFMVPAILDGRPPVLVALVGALAVMLVTVGLAHGTGVTSIAAILGSAASLLVTALLAMAFVELAQVTGFSSEEATLLRESVGSGSGVRLSLSGLVLAGIVVGALGVLDDVTVSQASTVLALHRAAPGQKLARLFREALSVGRDHLSATVNTLVLAYVGAALPILLLFESQGTSFGGALNREAVAGEVVAMLVGSIGLVLAVPLTTGLAAWLVHRLPRSVLEGAAAGHHHHH